MMRRLLVAVLVYTFAESLARASNEEENPPYEPDRDIHILEYDVKSQFTRFSYPCPECFAKVQDAQQTSTTNDLIFTLQPISRADVADLVFSDHLLLADERDRDHPYASFDIVGNDATGESHDVHMAYRTYFVDNSELGIASYEHFEFSVNGFDARTLDHFLHFNVQLRIDRGAVSVRSIGVQYQGRSFDVDFRHFLRSFRGCHGRGCPPSWRSFDGAVVPGIENRGLLWLMLMVAGVWLLWLYSAMLKPSSSRYSAPRRAT